MRISWLFALLLLSGSTAIAQFKPYNGDFQKQLIGKWAVLGQKSNDGPKSISFYADGIINMDDAKTKKVQRYKVTEAPNGYKVEVLELVNGSPISAFEIVSLSNDEMELTYKLDQMRFYVKLVKTAGNMQFLPAKGKREN